MASSTQISPPISERFRSLDIDNTSGIVFSARKGVKPKIFFDFADSINMPEKKLALLINISSRTIHNYKDQQKPLEPVQSEHLLKLIALFSRGEDIFGNIDEFNYWL